jgi:hypothetical protein
LHFSGFFFFFFAVSGIFDVKIQTEVLFWRINTFFRSHFNPFLWLFFCKTIFFAFFKFFFYLYKCTAGFCIDYTLSRRDKTAQLEIQTQTKVRSHATSKAKVNCVYFLFIVNKSINLLRCRLKKCGGCVCKTSLFLYKRV